MLDITFGKEFQKASVRIGPPHLHRSPPNGRGHSISAGLRPKSFSRENSSTLSITSLMMRYWIITLFQSFEKFTQFTDEHQYRKFTWFYKGSNKVGKEENEWIFQEFTSNYMSFQGIHVLSSFVYIKMSHLLSQLSPMCQLLMMEVNAQPEPAIGPILDRFFTQQIMERVMDWAIQVSDTFKPICQVNFLFNFQRVFTRQPITRDSTSRQ